MAKKRNKMKKHIKKIIPNFRIAKEKLILLDSKTVKGCDVDLCTEMSPTAGASDKTDPNNFLLNIKEL